MKKMNLRLMVTAVTMVMTLGLFVGCAKEEVTPSPAAASTAAPKLTGSIKVDGSSALYPVLDAIGKQLVAKNPDLTIDVQGKGSGAGLTGVSNKTIDIGTSDVLAAEKITDATKAKELVDHIICFQAFAVVVSKDVTVTNLTKAQIQDIFTGKVTNWKEVGGSDLAITVINRTKTSGTRATFKSTVMDNKDEKDGLGVTQDANGSVKTAMESSKGAISYLAMAYLVDETVKKSLNVLKIGGIEGTKANIVSKAYPFVSDGHIYTNGEATGVVKSFIAYMSSDEAKATMDKLGYFPAK